MKKNKTQPFDQHHDLSGYASIDLFNKDDFNSFAFKLTAYNADRFEPVALRVFFQRGNPVVTLYALDTFKQEQSNYPKDKLPVKKFKLKLSWDEFIRHIKRFDFTVSNGAFDIENMLVMNK
jgi:hypothetical protein